VSRKHRRYSLKSKEAKTLLNKASEKLKINIGTLIDAKASIEVIEIDYGEVFLINGKPLLFRTGEDVFPTLFFKEISARAPKIVVDMGAVPYVCNGADVMAPGIVRIEGEFSKGDIVMVVDEKYGKPLALGESLYDAESARNAKQGVLVKNLHFVSDKIWNFAKALAE
jgi:PUA domain protein